MAKPRLNADDFQRAAKKLKCSVAAIKAVADTESRGAGFYADGFPTLLFERHKFRQYTGGKYNVSHPRLSGPAGGYGAAGQNQQNKFNEAFALNPIAAMKSCSWGVFQVMGFNHAVCGYATVGEFVDAMKESEGKHLDAFVNFVINNGLADEIRNLNWKGFARGYNGSAYAKNQYDTKMAAAYSRFSKNSEQPAKSQTANNSNEDKIETAIETADTASQAAPNVEGIAVNLVPPTPPQADDQTIVSVPPVVTEQPQSIVSKIKTWYGAIGAGGAAVAGGFWSWLQGAATEIIVAFLAAAGVIATVWLITNTVSRNAEKRREADAAEKQRDRDFELTKLQLVSAMDPNKQTVRISPPIVLVPDVEPAPEK